MPLAVALKPTAWQNKFRKYLQANKTSPSPQRAKLVKRSVSNQKKPTARSSSETAVSTTTAAETAYELPPADLGRPLTSAVAEGLLPAEQSEFLSLPNTHTADRNLADANYLDAIQDSGQPLYEYNASLANSAQKFTWNIAAIERDRRILNEARARLRARLGEPQLKRKRKFAELREPVEIRSVRPRTALKYSPPQLYCETSPFPHVFQTYDSEYEPFREYASTRSALKRLFAWPAGQDEEVASPLLLPPPALTPELFAECYAWIDSALEEQWLSADSPVTPVLTPAAGEGPVSAYSTDWTFDAVLLPTPLPASADSAGLPLEPGDVSVPVPVHAPETLPERPTEQFVRFGSVVSHMPEHISIHYASCEGHVLQVDEGDLIPSASTSSAESHDSLSEPQNDLTDQPCRVDNNVDEQITPQEDDLYAPPSPTLTDGESAIQPYNWIDHFINTPGYISPQLVAALASLSIGPSDNAEDATHAISVLSHGILRQEEHADDEQSYASSDNSSFYGVSDTESDPLNTSAGDAAELTDSINCDGFEYNSRIRAFESLSDAEMPYLSARNEELLLCELEAAFLGLPGKEFPRIFADIDWWDEEEGYDDDEGTESRQKVREAED